MEHYLSLTTGLGRDENGHLLRSPVKVVRAETNLGPAPHTPIPEAFEGRLLGLELEDITRIKFGPDVEVAFAGAPYVFASLEKVGSFTLQRLYPASTDKAA